MYLGWAFSNDIFVTCGNNLIQRNKGRLLVTTQRCSPESADVVDELEFHVNQVDAQTTMAHGSYQNPVYLGLSYSTKAAHVYFGLWNNTVWVPTGFDEKAPTTLYWDKFKFAFKDIQAGDTLILHEAVLRQGAWFPRWVTKKVK